MLTQIQAAMVLNGLPGIGPIAIRRLSEVFDGDLANILYAEKRKLSGIPGIGKALAEKLVAWRALFDLEKEERALCTYGARFVPFFDSAFPPLLKEIPDAPPGLYVRGNTTCLKTRQTVGIVGTRKASLYGITNAKKIARDLALSGWCVVSGGARGIDTAAHKGALECGELGGGTLCILGCGLDIVYPPENLDLFRQIAESGSAVVSEFPFGKKADRRTFPQRNRIIAGISAGTLVVESDLSGGSIITANFAADCGRTVFALPGRIEQFGSRGCHKLIREGATLATCADDIIEELTGTPVQQTFHFEEKTEDCENTPATTKNLPAESEKILLILREGEALSPDTLAERTGMPFPLVSANLLLLELDRIIARKADGSYEIV